MLSGFRDAVAGVASAAVASSTSAPVAASEEDEEELDEEEKVARMKRRVQELELQNEALLDRLTAHEVEKRSAATNSALASQASSFFSRVTLGSGPSSEVPKAATSDALPNEAALENDMLRTQLSTLRQAYEELQRKSDLLADPDDPGGDDTSAEARVAALEFQLRCCRDGAAAREADLEEKIFSLEKKAKKDADNDELTEKVSHMQQRIDDLSSECEALEKARSTVEAENKVALEKITTLEDESTSIQMNMKAQMEELVKSLKIAEDAEAATASEHEAKVKILESIISSLRAARGANDTESTEQPGHAHFDSEAIGEHDGQADARRNNKFFEQSCPSANHRLFTYTRSHDAASIYQYTLPVGSQDYFSDALSPRIASTLLPVASIHRPMYILTLAGASACRQIDCLAFS